MNYCSHGMSFRSVMFLFQLMPYLCSVTTNRRASRDEEKGTSRPSPLAQTIAPSPQERIEPEGGWGVAVPSGHIRKIEKVDKDVDPREALLKYAKSASDNPYWVAPAYTG